METPERSDPGYDDDFENQAYEGGGQDPDSGPASTPDEGQPDQAEGEAEDA
jgi:hypothetical protein